MRNNLVIRNRYKVASPIRFTCFLAAIIVVAVFAFSSLLGLSQVSGYAFDSYAVIQVQPGDTLWSIAKDNATEKDDVRRLVYDIKQLNKLKDDKLDARQMLLIPSYK